MTDKLFREILNALLTEAEDRRDQCRADSDEAARDMWSAVAGNLDNARQRMRK